MSASRVHKTLLNARVNLLFYFLSLFFAFFSRKIFLDCLGADFIGLTGTLGNILNYLNLAELGIAAAVSYFLYAPLQSDDRQKICEIMSVLGYLYRCLGLVILGGGVVVSLFFPLMFSHTVMSLGIVYFAFYSLLGSALVGYFINYRQILLSADQKNYVVAMYMQSASLLRIGLQMFLAYYYKNLYLWVFVEFLFSLIGCVVLNWKINKEYPWLKTDKSQGRVLLKDYPTILTQTKQIFIHKIKDFFLGKSDELFIFAFVSLKMVAFYGNYIMIISKLSLLCSSVFDGVGAGVGNLVAEGDKQKMKSVFWELIAIRQLMAGFLCFSLYFLLEPFISIWLGQEYVMDYLVLVLLMANLYISTTRVVVDMFNHAYGHYADVWAAWVELIVNIAVTLVCGYYFGIVGILLGKLVSVFFIVLIWKPYYLFSQGFRVPFRQYVWGIGTYYIAMVVTLVITSMVAPHLPINPYQGFAPLMGYAACMLAIYTTTHIALVIMLGHGARGIVGRVHRLLRKNSPY